MDADLEDRVRKRAYELWQLNGQPEGMDQEFWTIALQELAPTESPERPPVGSDQPDPPVE